TVTPSDSCMGENRLLSEYMAHRPWEYQWPDYVTTWFRGVLLWGVDLDGETTTGRRGAVCSTKS
ncbi:MAG: hypothetical protein OXI23_17800, partial [Gemmatimonadota bacterium]|nr:hypothetical protein [Gemmatimonadota bacterium]